MMKAFIKKCIQNFAGVVGWRVAKAGKKKLIILMYHRVLPISDERYQFEEPGMVVSDASFRMHMQVIADESIPVLTPEQWIDMKESERPQLAVAITFDDGWLDNYQYAFPILKEFGFVSTLYIVTDYLGKPAPFWPNRVLRLLLSDRSVISDEWHDLINMMGEQPRLPVSRDKAASLIATLKKYRDDEIYEALENVSLSEPSQIEMIDETQLLDAQASMGVVIGCHTRRHYRLVDGLSDNLLEEEIVESKHILERLTSIRPTTFCFPNGDFSEKALALVKTHYCNAVTTKRGHNVSGEVDAHQLVRIGVHNDISDTPLKFKARLSSYV